MFFIYRFLILLPVANIMCQDMVFRNPMWLTWKRSQNRVKFLHWSIMTLGTLGTMIGSTFWIFSAIFCLINVAHWIHICPQPSQHLLTKLRSSAGFYYKLCVVFSLFVGWWCAVIALRNHTSLHHMQCIFSSFPPLLVWGSVNNLPCCTRYYFWEGASYCGRRDDPCLSWVFTSVGYERKFIAILTVVRSVDVVSAKIQAIESFLTPLGYIRQYLGIQGVRQFFWCRLLLHCSGHVDIFHQ